MKRSVVSLILLMALTGCALGGPAEDASGEEIYAELCARCHGADLGGGVGPALGPGSNSANETDEYLEFTIVNGRGRMPSFPSLSQQQVDRLIAHIREVEGQ
ncbi:MAG: cytochrome c [Acidimicrobiia bacterium]|jgi:mono/diheme cytochrome c family protein